MNKTKEYKLNWITDDGDIITLSTIVTSNPKETLFNEVCKMIVTAPMYFNVKDMKDTQIKNNIKSGVVMNREFYLIDINNNVLNLVETLK